MPLMVREFPDGRLVAKEPDFDGTDGTSLAKIELRTPYFVSPKV